MFENMVDCAETQIKNDKQLEQIYEILDDAVLGEKKEEDKMKELGDKLKGLDFPPGTMAMIGGTMVCLGGLAKKGNDKLDKMFKEKFGEDLNIYEEGVRDDRLEQMYEVGGTVCDFVTVLTFIYDMMDAYSAIYDITQVSEQLKEFKHQIKNRYQNEYRQYYKGLSTASVNYQKQFNWKKKKVGI